MNLPKPSNLMYTIGVMDWLEKEQFPPYLMARIVNKESDKQPDECLDGGNDKRFFSFISRGQKFFAAENEEGGLTLMLPEEY
jgi:hypothetical protein